MEIAAQINNFSYYHHSKTIYCNVEILEKGAIDLTHPSSCFFTALEKNQTISLKYIDGNCADILPILQNRILRIKLSLVEQPKNHNQGGIKYIFETVQSCGILMEN